MRPRSKPHNCHSVRRTPLSIEGQALAQLLDQLEIKVSKGGNLTTEEVRTLMLLVATPLGPIQ